MMQLKLRPKKSIGDTLIKTVIKSIIIIALLIFGIFLLEKIKFPSPTKNFKIDITNETIKLK